MNNPIGTIYSDNARLHNERASATVNWVPSVTNGGLIFEVTPTVVRDTRCEHVVISGWRIGTGNDITKVTLKGGKPNTAISL